MFGKLEELSELMIHSHSAAIKRGHQKVTLTTILLPTTNLQQN